MNNNNNWLGLTCWPRPLFSFFCKQFFDALLSREKVQWRENFLQCCCYAVEAPGRRLYVDLAWLWPICFLFYIMTFFSYSYSMLFFLPHRYRMRVSSLRGLKSKDKQGEAYWPYHPCGWPTTKEKERRNTTSKKQQQLKLVVWLQSLVVGLLFLYSSSRLENVRPYDEKNNLRRLREGERVR